MSGGLRVTELIRSIGLPAPEWNEPFDTCYPKIADALEKLIAVAKAANSVNANWDEGGPEHFERVMSHLHTALSVLEFK